MPESETKQSSSALVEFLTHYRSPSAVAGGLSIGVAIGIVPKDSLIVVLLLCLLLVMRVNHFIACTTAISMTIIASWIPFPIHRIGMEALRFPWVGNLLVLLYSVPFLPWLRLENSHVMGGLAIGSTLWLPVFFAARWILTPRHVLAREPQVYELAATALRRQKIESDALVSREQRSIGELVHQRKFQSASASAGDSEQSITQPTTDPGIAHSQTIDEQAGSESKTPPSLSTFPSEPSSELEVIEFEESVLRETLIEVVRYKHPQSTLQSSRPDEDPSTIPLDSMSMSLATTTPTIAAPKDDQNIQRHPSHTIPESKSGTVHSSSIHIVNHPGREESLRHILKHIHGVRESRKSTEKPA